MARELRPYLRAVVGLVLVAAVAVAAVVGYRHWTERYAVATDDGGVAVARVVAARLSGAGELRVSRLTGTVQATAATSRLWGWLTSTRIVKAPFETDYFVDLDALAPRDFRYDPAARRLLVEVPDVVVGRPNVDEANVTVDRTSGVYVSREAMAELQRRAAATATRVVADKAREPENILRARENGRRAISRLFEGALGAAGLPVTVEVRYRGEAPPANTDRWDLTRSLEEVLRDNP